MPDFHLLKIGSCVHPEAIVHPGRSWKKKTFPAIIGLLKHQKAGYMLFDTGYSSQFTQATQSFPNRLYRWLTPMHIGDDEQLLFQLKQLGITVSDITHIFISHFHGDHIAGLNQFPKAKFICSKRAVADFYLRKGLKGLLKGYLPSLLPVDFASRVIFIENQSEVSFDSRMEPFAKGYDLFADMGYVAIPLPGHAFGQFDLLYTCGSDSNFLVADACWSEEAYQQLYYPSKIANFIMADPVAYKETIQKLHCLSRQNQDINIYPSHCEASFLRWKKRHIEGN